MLVFAIILGWMICGGITVLEFPDNPQESEEPSNLWPLICFYFWPGVWVYVLYLNIQNYFDMMGEDDE